MMGCAAAAADPWQTSAARPPPWDHNSFLPQPLARVNKLPMDAPDHSWIDPDDVPAAFEKHFGKQQRQQEGAAAQQQQRANGVQKDEL